MNIIGQNQALASLRSSLLAGRLHHALVFHGPEGVGKFTTAAYLGRALLCSAALTDRADVLVPCGRCESCRLLSNDSDGAHPDFHVITKELARYSTDASVRQRKLTTIPVDVLRRFLIEPVYRASGLGRGKVFVIDEAHLLDVVGQNLLLKTLEEPPPDTRIVLVTSSESRLLTTVRSRCHRVPFTPLTNDQVRAWVEEPPGNVDAEDALPIPSGTDLEWLVRFAAGSLGRAEVAMRYDLAEWARVVLPANDAMARGIYPDELGGQMAAMIDAFAKRWVQEHANASKEAANQRAAALLWGIIAQEARARLADTSQETDADDINKLQVRVTPWLGVVDALAMVEKELAAHVNIGLAADHLVSLMYRSISGGQAPLMPCG